MNVLTRTRIRRTAAAVLAVGTLFGLTVLPSTALYTDQDSVTANTFSTGTIDIAETSGTRFTASGLVPGDTITAPLTLENPGSAGLRYAMQSTTTEDTLASALVLTFKTRSLADTTCSAFDGTILYTGILGSTTGTKIVGDPASGAQSFDRWLDAGQKDIWCARVSLPVTASNTTAALTTTATFTFAAEQVANNGPMYQSPTLTGQAWAYIPGTGSATITVPPGVTDTDLGVLATGTDNSTVQTVSVPGWTTRAANPAGQNNFAWSALTRLGGLKAGDTFTLTITGTPNTAIGVTWYNTGGRDVVQVGTPGTRGGVASPSTVIPGITTTPAETDILLVASERTLNTKSVTGWAPADVAQDAYQNNSSASVSHTFAHLKQTTAGATGSRTITYSYVTASGNGAGLMLALGPANRY